MQNYSFDTQNVCAKNISFTINEGKLYSVHFKGGCPGNLLAISKLLEGADAKRAVELLKGNPCGMKKTSCTDQLALAVQKALEQ